MINAIDHLIAYALGQGAVISVFDGEDWDLALSTDQAAIRAAVSSVEEAQLQLNKDSVRVGWALVSEYGLADDEKVIDYTDNEFMSAWWDQYEKDCEEVRPGPLSDAQYVQRGGSVCPYCGSTDIYCESFDVEARTVTQGVYCTSCDAEWYDVYTLTGYTPH